jgi:hypothetical protein
MDQSLISTHAQGGNQSNLYQPSGLILFMTYAMKAKEE